MAQGDIKYKFMGQRGPGGVVTRFLAGIPAKDLTQADMDKLSPEQRKRVRASNLYEAVKEEKPKADDEKPARKAKDDAEPEAEAPAEEAAV